MSAKRRLARVVKEEPPPVYTPSERMRPDGQIDWTATLWSIADQGWHRVEDPREDPWAASWNLTRLTNGVAGLSVVTKTVRGERYVKAEREAPDE